MARQVPIKAANGLPVYVTDGPYTSATGRIDHVDAKAQRALVDFGEGRRGGLTWVPIKWLATQDGGRPLRALKPGSPAERREIIQGARERIEQLRRLARALPPTASSVVSPALLLACANDVEELIARLNGG